MSPWGQPCPAFKPPDVVQAQKSAFKDILTEAVFTIYPPVEVQRQFGKNPLEKGDFALAAECLLGPVQENRRPRMHRWIDIAEVPLVRGELAARMEVVHPKHQIELVLGEIDIDCRKGDRMKRQVPGGIPRIFPLI